MRRLCALLLLLVLMLVGLAAPLQELARAPMGDLVADPAVPFPLPPLPWPPKEDSNAIRL